MQINPLRPGSTAVDRSSREGVARTAPRDAAASPVDPAAKSAVAKVVRGGLRSLDADLNRQVAGAQQALDFLDQLESRLQALKASLSGRLAEGSVRADLDRLDRQLQQLTALWERRRDASGGSLDGQLALKAPDETRQGFRVRGLDRRSLASGDRETLSFAVAGRRNLSVVVDPELPLDTVVRRLGHALMPAGITVGRDAQGELKFEANESVWPEIRDTFAVKGNGRRFAGGQFNRVALDADPDALRPHGWTTTDDPKAIRQVLQEVIASIERVRHARAAVSEALASARNRFDSDTVPVDSLWADTFVQEFAAIAERPGFSVFSAIAPALIAVSRQRVVSLLALG